VLRKLRGEREGRGEHEGRARSPYDRARNRDLPPTSDAIRVPTLALVGPVVLIGWWLASHAQANPSGGFQGGVILATAFMLVYLSGEFGYPPGERPPVPPGSAPDGRKRHRIGRAEARRIPVALLDGAEALGAGAFVAVGLAAVAQGLPYLDNFLPLGQVPGAVSSSGTIALISFFVGIEVAAAFTLIIGELLEQTLLVRAGGR
jgi:multicomponent Na+:H+ antiporter subunit B